MRESLEHDTDEDFLSIDREVFWELPELCWDHDMIRKGPLLWEHLRNSA